jgi:hypothetical protein
VQEKQGYAVGGKGEFNMGGTPTGGPENGMGMIMITVFSLLFIVVSVVVPLVVLWFAFKYGAVERTKHVINAACGVTEFSGKGNKYVAKWYEHFFVKFGYGLIGYCFMFITLGFSLAWADTQRRKWIYAKTYIGGDVLGYTGESVELWVKRIIWMLLSVVTFGIYYFLVKPIREQKFLSEHLHFNGVNSGNASAFNGKIIDFFLIRVTAFVMFFTIIGIPFALSMLESYNVTNRVIDGNKLVFHGAWNAIFARTIFFAVLTVMTSGWWLLLAGDKAMHTFETEVTTTANAR